MEQTDVRAEDVDAYRDAFKRGWDAAKRKYCVAERVETLEALTTLPAGSCVKDAAGKVLFRTRGNGWVTLADTHFSSKYIPLPVEVLYHATQ